MFVTQKAQLVILALVVVVMAVAMMTGATFACDLTSSTGPSC